MPLGQEEWALEEEGPWILIPALTLSQKAESSFCLHMTSHGYNQVHGSSLGLHFFYQMLPSFPIHSHDRGNLPLIRRSQVPHGSVGGTGPWTAMPLSRRGLRLDRLTHVKGPWGARNRVSTHSPLPTPANLLPLKVPDPSSAIFPRPPAKQGLCPWEGSR